MTSPTPRGTVYLVGAGPGDPELITVRGQKLVMSADVLLYDALVSPHLITMSPAPEKVFVGKTHGGQAMTQERINALLVEYASSGWNEIIVRLKGGDPFVFGRGGEEFLACALAGVPCEVVPGVTSGIGALAAAGIPVTHRKVSRGCLLLTGHREGGNFELPWRALVEARVTLVWYMGVNGLAEISLRLLEHGMAASTPTAIVQEGSLPSMRVLRSTLGAITEEAAAAGIRPPALTVVGEVVTVLKL